MTGDADGNGSERPRFARRRPLPLARPSQFVRSILRAGRTMLEVLLALILLFEEWGWRPLANLIGELRRFKIWERLEGWIEKLPPYGALCVFALPVALVFPFKVLALYLVATGHLISAAALLIAAKLAGTAVLARIFVLTQPRLMQIGWFASVHDTVMPWKEALFERIRATWAWRYARVLKARTKAAMARGWDTLQAGLAGWRASMAGLASDIPVLRRPGFRQTWRRQRPRSRT